MISINRERERERFRVNKSSQNGTEKNRREQTKVRERYLRFCSFRCKFKFSSKFCKKYKKLCSEVLIEFMYLVQWTSSSSGCGGGDMRPIQLDICLRANMKKVMLSTCYLDSKAANINREQEHKINSSWGHTVAQVMVMVSFSFVRNSRYSRAQDDPEHTMSCRLIGSRNRRKASLTFATRWWMKLLPDLLERTSCKELLCE